MARFKPFPRGAAALLAVTLALSACTSSQMGLSVDLDSGAVSPSFTGTNGNATLTVGG